MLIRENVCRSRRRAVVAAAALAFLIVPAPATPAGAGSGDAIFGVDLNGNLEPIAVRTHGVFMKAEPTDGSPGPLGVAAIASLAAAHNTVHLIFGGRVVATVPATVRHGAATVQPPTSLHLNETIDALASPTLGGNAHLRRRAPTHVERAAVLALASAKLGTTPARLSVDNLTAIDLGDGMAFAGSVNAKGTGASRKDHRLFFLAETAKGRLALTLANTQTITVSEPLLEQVGEALIDAIDLGDGHLSVVTRQVGYDAHIFVVYSRAGSGWKPVYTGGGIAV